MPRKGRKNEEIVPALHLVEAGGQVTDFCRPLGISEQTFHRWKKQFAGVGAQEVRELRRGQSAAGDLSNCTLVHRR